MKKHILAISIIVLMLFASCDGNMVSIMEKFGDNVVSEYVPEQTVGNDAPAKEDASNAVIGQLVMANGGSVGGEFVSGVSSADKENLQELKKNNPDAIEAMKNTPATEKQMESAEAVLNTAGTLNAVLDSLGDISQVDMPEGVKELVTGIVDSINNVASKAAPDAEPLTQADVVGIQAVAGLVNDLATCIPEDDPIIIGEGENEKTVTSQDVLQVVLSGGQGASANGVTAEDLGALIQDEEAKDVVDNLVSSVTENISIMEMMGMTNGVNVESLITGLLGFGK
ncbi:MAG: hypothetical protein II339_03390 [Spirochaetales bacterium]|nr:hypothetical protein [Spirochaetales bacterium]